MMEEFKSVFDVEREEGYEEGYEYGYEEGMQQAALKYQHSLISYLPKRFPRISQPVINRILSITDLDVLASILDIAVSAGSYVSFKKNVSGLIPTN